LTLKYFARYTDYFDKLTDQVSINATCDLGVANHIAFYCSSGYVAVHPLLEFIVGTSASSMKELKNMTPLKANKVLNNVPGVKGVNLVDYITLSTSASFIYMTTYSQDDLRIRTTKQLLLTGS